MTTFTQVDPNVLMDVDGHRPANGRGAWVREGIGFDYRYAINPAGQPRIGTVAERSLAHWAVAAGAWAVQARLTSLGHLVTLPESERGIFGPKTRAAVRAFQAVSRDPDGGAALQEDGTVGRSDARALFGPLLASAEHKYSIPSRLLVGETNHESRLDPGAVGYFIFYPDYRGVDRGMSQINSRANPSVSWRQAFDPVFSIGWSGARLRRAHDDFKAANPKQVEAVLWDAAVCNHNNPAAARRWAELGYAPTPEAAKYVSDTLAARF